MNPASATLWVALGSALGGVARYWAALGVAGLTGPRLPWGTWLINVVGSFVIGWVSARVVSDELRLFLAVGICGGFTTFSSFSLQSVALLQAGETGWAFAYVVGSVVVCLAAAASGLAVGR